MQKLFWVLSGLILALIGCAVSVHTAPDARDFHGMALAGAVAAAGAGLILAKRGAAIGFGLLLVCAWTLYVSHPVASVASLAIPAGLATAGGAILGVVTSKPKPAP